MLLSRMSDLYDFVSPAAPEARQRYCFSGVVGGGVGGASLCQILVKICFSGTIKAKVMKVGPCLHLNKES